MRDTEFLEELKAGDKLIVQSSGPLRSDRVGTVKRTTKTLIVLVSGHKYRKASGRMLGGNSSYNWSYLREYTEGAALSIATREMRESLEHKIHKGVLKDLTLTALIQIGRLLP